MIGRTSLSFKFIAGFLTILTLFITTIVIIIIKLKGIQPDIVQLNQGYLPYLHHLSKIQLNITNDKQVIHRFFSDGEFRNAYFRIFYTRFQKHPVWNDFKEIETLETRYQGEPFSTFATRETKILKNYYQQLLSRCLEAFDDESVIQSCEGMSGKLFNRINYLNKQLETRIASLSGKIEQARSSVTLLAITTGTLSIVISILIIILIILSILPIRKLIYSITRVKEGDYSQRVDLKSSGEIRELVDSFNGMIIALKSREEQISTQQNSLQEHHQAELAIKNRLIDAEHLAAIGKISAQIVHEIRNPLNSITLNTDIIEDEVFSEDFEPGEIRPIFQSIKKEIQRLSDITESYLQFAKAPKLNKKPFELIPFLVSLKDFIQPEMEERQIDFQLHYNPSTLWVSWDRNRMRQLLLNLLKNGMEATPAGGEIKLDVEISDIVTLKISDSGIGISKENLKEVFNPFFTTKNYGTGLGLYLVKEITLEHGGVIDVVSNFGAGATFVIQLDPGEGS